MPDHAINELVVCCILLYQIQHHCAWKEREFNTTLGIIGCIFLELLFLHFHWAYNVEFKFFQSIVIQ